MSAASWVAEIAGPAPARVSWLAAADGVRLRVALWRPEGAPRGVLHLLPGRTEYLEKYAPLARRLAEAGLAVAGLDWRGQGLSDRDPRVGRLGHVESFADYARDLDALLGWPEATALPGPRLALAHSMGGCIALRGLVSGAFAPDAVLFSAPMWGLAQPAPVLALAGLLARTARALGLGRLAAPGQGGAAPYVLSTAPERNVLVADPRAFDRLRQEVSARPDLAVHAPTLAWLAAALEETASLRRAPALGVPATILLGDDEAVVSAAAIRARAASDPALEVADIPGARHEPLMEPPDGVPGAAVAAALDRFLVRHAPV
ncbi:MAG TPA: alpha/beta hydrolase [Paracoccaceae bacterium]|nr:alpha/beta hydrolase [Paracoccaceae bacterium]